jgi:RNA polymerase sigma-70 factor (ECF subfamily)
MEAVAATAAPAEEGLDAPARAGDRQAFLALYGPHFEAVYDFVLRVVRDRDVAADVVVETFAKAWRVFPEQGNEVSAWLYTTACARALDALRYRRDRGVEREALVFTIVDGDRVPDASVVFDRELVELVWDTAAALSPDEYSLLALHVRHDLGADEIGEQLGLNGAVATRLTRARAAFDEQVTSELLVRRARHNCAELEILAANGDSRAISQHIRRCARCRECARSFVSPTEVLGAIGMMAPTRKLRGRALGDARCRRVFGIL